MIVIVANDLPPAVRGKLKLWFVEPKPNVFVSGIKDALANRVADLVMQYCAPNAGLVIFKSIAKPPFYQILTKGLPQKSIEVITGLQLALEKKVFSEEELQKIRDFSRDLI